MPQDSATFLTISQAVDAFAADFGQYGSQSVILHKIGPLILGGNFTLRMSNGRQRAWIRRVDDFPHEPVDDTALGFYLIHCLETADPHAKDMAKICSLVFETPARPGKFKEESGVWVESQMAGFSCRRCGNCCCCLANACAEEDVRLWERFSREDILAWVKPEPLDNGETQYRIWVDPQTGELAESCPFLAKQPGTNLSCCTIQEVKPLVCREYPFTRKHARLTGCPGFENRDGSL